MPNNPTRGDSVTLTLDEWVAVSAAVSIAADCAKRGTVPLLEEDSTLTKAIEVTRAVHRRRADEATAAERAKRR